MELNFVVFWCVTLFTVIDRYQPFQLTCSVNIQLHLKSWYICNYHAIQCIYHKTYLYVHWCENQHSGWVI